MTLRGDFLGNTWDNPCIGCAIATGQMTPPGGMLAQAAHFRVHQDPLIPLPGCVVIAARRHIQRLDELTADEYDELAKLLRRTQQAIHAAAQLAYLSIIQEEQSQHWHLWFFPWTAQVIAQHGQPSLSKIRPIIAEYYDQTISQQAWLELQAVLEVIRAALNAVEG